MSCAPGQWVPKTEMSHHDLSKSKLRAEPRACSSCLSARGFLMWVTLPPSTSPLPQAFPQPALALPGISWFHTVSGRCVQTPLQCIKTQLSHSLCRCFDFDFGFDSQCGHSPQGLPGCGCQAATEQSRQHWDGVETELQAHREICNPQERCTVRGSDPSSETGKRRETFGITAYFSFLFFRISSVAPCAFT